MMCAVLFPVLMSRRDWGAYVGGSRIALSQFFVVVVWLKFMLVVSHHLDDISFTIFSLNHYVFRGGWGENPWKLEGRDERWIRSWFIPQWHKPFLKKKNILLFFLSIYYQGANMCACSSLLDFYQCPPRFPFFFFLLLNLLRVCRPPQLLFLSLFGFDVTVVLSQSEAKMDSNYTIARPHDSLDLAI